MKVEKQKQKVENAEVTLTIEELAQNVLANRTRVEEQRAAILVKIDELKKELNAPAHIPNKDVDSFSIEDIEASATPKTTRDEIARRIVALTNASELTVYSDKGYMDSIYEYLKAIRPEIEQIDAEQWDLIAFKKRIQKEYEDGMRDMWKSYNNLNNEIKELLKVVDINYPKAYGYNKHVTPGLCWTQSVNNVVSLVDDILRDKDKDSYIIRRSL